MRQYKYFLVKSTKEFLSFSKNSIYLFTHVNERNALENSIINSFLKKNNVISLSIRSKLIKRLNLHRYFFPLYQGPTQILKFDDINSFYSFFQSKEIKGKFLPLLVYWNGNIFSFNWFQQYLKVNFYNSGIEQTKTHKILSLMSFLQSNITKLPKILTSKNLLLLLEQRKKNI